MSENNEVEFIINRPVYTVNIEILNSKNNSIIYSYITLYSLHFMYSFVNNIIIAVPIYEYIHKKKKKHQE